MYIMRWRLNNLTKTKSHKFGFAGLWSRYISESVSVVFRHTQNSTKVNVRKLYELILLANLIRNIAGAEFPSKVK